MACSAAMLATWLSDAFNSIDIESARYSAVATTPKATQSTMINTDPDAIVWGRVVSLLQWSNRVGVDYHVDGNDQFQRAARRHARGAAKSICTLMA